MTAILHLLEAELAIPPDIGQLLIAVALIALAASLGHALSRWSAPACRAWAKARIGTRGEDFGERLPKMLRYASTALFIAVVMPFADFTSFALMLVAAALGGAIGLLIHAVLRSAGVTRPVATLLGFAVLVMITASALGGLDPLADSLDRAGVNVGKRRISLLALASFALVTAILFAATRIANRVLTHAVGRLNGLDLSQRVLVQKIGSLFVVVAAFLIGIDILGIDLTTLTVFSGALGLAVGFGLQKTFGNLIAGLILLMDKSVKPGDVVAVGTTFGTINKIGVRAVSVITRDGKEHLIPNEQLMTQPVENWSFSSRDVRIHIPVTIAYDSDVALAQKLMIEAATASRRALKTPAPTVWLLAFGERGLEHDIRVWILDPEQGVGNVQSDILNRLLILFRDHGIRLPFPQYDVHLDARAVGEMAATLRGEGPPA
jgi:small-conductance mechanosensitive channel